MTTTKKETRGRPRSVNGRDTNVYVSDVTKKQAAELMAKFPNEEKNFSALVRNAVNVFYALKIGNKECIEINR